MLLTSALLTAPLTACNTVGNDDTITTTENADETTTETVEETTVSNEEETTSEDIIDLKEFFDISASENTDHIITFSGYDEILTLYKKLLTDNDIAIDDFTNLSSEQPYFSDLYSVSVNIDPQKAGYALKDLNHDLIPELILLDDDGIIFSIYTMKDQHPLLVEYFQEFNPKGSIDANGIIYKKSYSKGESWGVKLIRILDNGELDWLEFGIYDPDPGIIEERAYLYRNGTEKFVDRVTVEALYTEYSHHISNSSTTDTITSLELNFIYGK